MVKIAIVGAGFSGLVLARALRRHADVVVFEKSRSPGGRLATRRAGDFEFDHGAQFFTARGAAFRAFLEPLVAARVVEPWSANFVELGPSGRLSRRRWGTDPPHYVAVPAMNALGKHLAADVELRTSCRIARIEPHGESWLLEDEAGTSLGAFDWVLLAIPAQQARALMPADFAHAGRLSRPDMLGCYALMIGFDRPLPLSFDAALVKDADISWLSVNNSKPGRPPAFSMVALASNAWADAHIDTEPGDVENRLREVLTGLLGHDLDGLSHTSLHRWRYANIGRQKGPRSLLDPRRRLGVCGDWCVHGRVEGAYLSGMDLAERLRGQLA
jgi:renalase